MAARPGQLNTTCWTTRAELLPLGRAVVLVGVGETLRIPGHEVVELVLVRLPFAMAPPAALAVTTGDPVLVAGTGVDAALSSP